MKANFSDHPSYGLILDAVAEAGVKSSQGRAMSLRIDGLPTAGAKMSSMDVRTYRYSQSLVKKALLSSIEINLMSFAGN